MQQEKSCIELYTASGSDEREEFWQQSMQSLQKNVTYEEVKAVYDKYYADEKFVRVLEKDRVRRQNG